MSETPKLITATYDGAGGHDFVDQDGEPFYTDPTGEVFVLEADYAALRSQLASVQAERNKQAQEIADLKLTRCTEVTQPNGDPLPAMCAINGCHHDMLLAQVETLKAEHSCLNAMRTHCEHCGADYMATGVEAGCPCKMAKRAEAAETTLATLREQIEAMLLGRDGNDDWGKGWVFGLRWVLSLLPEPKEPA